MSKYKGGRRGGAAVVALGWVIVALPVLAMMFVIASVLGAQLGPVIAAALLPSAVVAGLAGFCWVMSRPLFSTSQTPRCRHAPDESCR